MDDFAATLSNLTKIVSAHRYELPSRPILPPPFPFSDSDHGIPTSLPIHSRSLADTFKIITDRILPQLGTYNSPRFFGFVTGGVTDAALLADMLLPSIDRHVQVHSNLDPLPVLLESLVLHFILSLLSPTQPTLLQKTFSGRTITTGATASNVLGIACGRDAVLKQLGVDVSTDGYGGKKVLVFHPAAHASVGKAASLVGIGRKNCIDLGTNDRPYEFDLVKLEERLREAREKEEGVIVVTQLGEVNTGGMTPSIPKIRELCDKYDAWLHMDGAFGAFGALLPTYFPTLSNDMSLADSLTLDGHKWLNVPYDTGLFFCRSVALQSSIFNINASYLSTTDIEQSSLDLVDPLPPLSQIIEKLESPLNLGIENSRRFRALPLFASLISLGREGYTELIERNISFARRIVSWMSGPGSAYYDLLLPQDDNFQILNIVLFKPKSETSVQVMVQRINETGKMYITPTKWKGVSGARLAVSNWMTALDRGSGSDEDWKIVCEVLESVGKSL